MGNETEEILSWWDEYLRESGDTLYATWRAAYDGKFFPTYPAHYELTLGEDYERETMAEKPTLLEALEWAKGVIEERD